MLGFVSLATIMALSVWFSTNAIAPALESKKGFTPGDLAWLTIAVQLGFALGTLISASLNLADVFSVRRLFVVSAILAAACNLLTIPLDGFWTTLIARLATGAFLAGVYPPAMKILSGWFQKGRGLALGTMVGALTLGSGSPHLLRSVFVDNWQISVIGSSILAAIGGLLLIATVSDGPYDAKGARFNPRYSIRILRQRDLRLAFAGYFGHMWELYAMWAWIGAYFFYIFGVHPLIGDRLELASLLAFIVFAVGALGCILGGLTADRYGRTTLTSAAMVISGTMAFVIGFLPEAWGILIVILTLIWGASIIADSAQFSTAATELSDPTYRGTVLTLQTGLGFALTAVSIRLVPWLADSIGWGVAFAILGIGPVLGTFAMLRLRMLPESRKLAGGRR